MIDQLFAEPQWVHLIWFVVALTAILVWLDQRGSRGLERFLSKLMQQRLVSRPKRSRRLLRIAFLGLSGVCLVLALMRPQSGFHRVQTPRIGARLMICLDVSRSMLAEDVAPNRIKRAKAEIEYLLAFLDTDHVGLVAFAGKATVLCPLTPDFGFLRQRLQWAGPHSVARGGTDLEAPIRKALDGFRGDSDLSRAIILITDGEDHSSFALEAAKTASEQGIRIIAIGFGDEAGSHVFVTDPTTGARTQLRDGDGEPVVTRLDGELLRKIALATDGRYIPAGTGALDLASIYDAHLAPLTRGHLDDRGRLVKQEQYQWMVLAALVFLVGALAVVHGRPRCQQELGGQAATVAGAVVVLLAVAIAPASADQQADGPPDETSVAAGEGGDEVPIASVPEDDEAIDPRATYNQAVAHLNALKLDSAETKLTLARDRAGADGQTRYRSTYNLGWVEIKRADQHIKGHPQQALSHLNTAADWFREAVKLQPHQEEARQNLEIVTRRAMALADALARKEPPDVVAQLDELIQQQRQLIGLIQATVERAQRLEQPTVPDHLRSEFRSLEVQQRKILGRLDDLAQEVRGQIEHLEAIDEQQRQAQQRLRLAQLTHVEAYLYQASQRVGQTRRHLRGRQAQRAYRRASAALGQLKRARDQLRNLVEVLGAVAGDAISLTRKTALLAAAASQALGMQGGRPRTPSWLTQPYLEEALATVRGRTDELVARVEAGLAQGPSGSVGEADDPSTPAAGDAANAAARNQQDMEQLLSTLKEAAPLIREARDAFDEAAGAFKSQRDQDAYLSEVRATAQLLKARELFLDIRGLIEAIYHNEKRMQTVLGAANQAKAPSVGEFLPLLGQLQSANVKRGQRLERLIHHELEALGAEGDTSGSAPAEPPSDADKKARRQQLELARQFLAALLATFSDVEKSIDRMADAESKGGSLDQLRTYVDRSLDQLEDLRRLFFSIVEHLRQTARRQVELADETRDVATLTEEDGIHEAVGPLVPRQQELASISQQIAESLKKQSEHGPGQRTAEEKVTEHPSQDVGQRLLQASGCVREAEEAMNQAVGQMTARPIDLKASEQHQQTALEKLLEALELLAPPPPPQQNQQQNGRNDQQQGQQEKAEPQQREPQMDLSHLLQAVRDREAQRQQQKRRRQPTGYELVEKDW